MQDTNVFPRRTELTDFSSHEDFKDVAIQHVKCAFRENIDLLRAGSCRCIDVALVASEDVAATMIDYAIELNVQTKDAIKRYGAVVGQWGCLA